MRAVRVILLVAALTLAACTQQPKRQVSAVVVSIVANINPTGDGDEVIVTARSADGAFGKKFVPADRLNCRVGDTVHASVRGLALTLDNRAYQR